MGLFTHLYKKNLIVRYDKDPAIPYYSSDNFDNLHVKESSFINHSKNKIVYFEYNYKNYDKDKTVLFLHGLGPGHTAYLTEINYICSMGYKVITLDYTGCDKSEGESMLSMNQPTNDVLDLLNLLKIENEIILVGHSLGGYTALNVINIRNEIKKAVIISGFISMEDELMYLSKSKLFTKAALRYEKKMNHELFSLDNKNYLKHTNNRLMFIHSKDDMMVSFNSTIGFLRSINNQNIAIIETDGKKHNPNYSLDAVNYMNEVFGTYNALIKNKELKTVEDRIAFMSDKSIAKMTEQDPVIMNKILEFIKS